MIALPVVLVALFVALIAQYFLPPLAGPWYPGARLLLLPVVMFYGTLALPFWAGLTVCAVAGFLWDALTAQVVDSAVEISLGWSIMLYACLGAIMSGFRPLFRRGRWEVHCLMSGLLTAVIVLAEYLMITFRRGDFLFPAEVWLRLAGTALGVTLVAPVVFLALDRVLLLLRHDPHPERPSGGRPW